MLYVYLLILVSGVVMGLTSLVEKHALINEHATAYSASFSVITALMALIFLPFTDMRISIVDVGLIYLISLLSTLTYILTARVYKHGNISIASPLFSSVPQLLIVVLAFIFLSEKLTLIKYASIAVIVIAVYALVFRTNTGGKMVGRSKYTYTLAADVLLMAVAGILMKYTLYKVPPLTYLIIAGFFIAVNMSVYITIRYGGAREVLHNISVYWAPIVLISGLTLLYRAAYYFALAETYVSLASPLRNGADVLIAVIGGGMMFGEKTIKRKLILSAIILIAIYFLVT